MAGGGPRTGAGRPKGAVDGPLAIRRALTTAQAKELVETAEIAKARTQVAAWEALHQQIADLNKLPVKERVPILALALKYTEPRGPAPSVNVTVEQQGGGDIVRARLQKLAAGLPPEVIDLVHRRELAGEEIVDAEIVEPDPAEVLHRRQA